MSSNPGAPVQNTNYQPGPPPPQFSYPYIPQFPPIPQGFQPPSQNFQPPYQSRGNFRNRDNYHGKRNDYHNRNNNRGNNHNDQRQERDDPIHTVFFHNIDYNISNEEFRNYAAQFGEISNVFVKFEKGIAFVTYYDIRSAEKAVKSEYGKINGRVIKTSFAYRPPAHSKRDPCESCSTVQVTADSLTLDDVKEELAKFGEIREAKNGDESNEFIIKFYNLKSAKSAVQNDGLDIKGKISHIKYLPEEDEGDDPADHPPLHHHHSRNNSNSSNNGGPQMPFPAPYGAPMQPPFDQMGYPYPGMFGQPYPGVPPMYGYTGVPPPQYNQPPFMPQNQSPHPQPPPSCQPLAASPISPPPPLAPIQNPPQNQIPPPEPLQTAPAIPSEK